jgi:integrase
MVAVSTLIQDLDAELLRLGYKEPTMRWYRGRWKSLEAFFAARGSAEFTLDSAMAWVDESCGFFAKGQAGELKAHDLHLFRVAHMLADFADRGAVLRRYSRSVSRLSVQAQQVVDGFREWCRRQDLSPSTVRTYGTVAGEFAAFAETRGPLADADNRVVVDFTAALAGYQFKTVEQKLCALRRFFEHTAAAGVTRAGLAGALPPVKARKQTRIPSVWDPADVTKMLAGIDRGNPGGKRDYAVVLLVTRLGLRGVDVKRLRFADIDWAGNRLSVEQAKTGGRVWLPLLKDVGWAVIDYIRSGRPACRCPEVFVRHNAPVGPFADQDHLHDIVVRCARAARVALGPERRHGMHSLRHTLATKLMEDHTPVEQIAQILGHQSPESTGVYLKASLGLLAECALDPDAADQGAQR